MKIATILWVAIGFGLLGGCARIEVQSRGRTDYAHPERVAGPSERMFLVSYRNGVRTVHEGNFNEARQNFAFSGLLPGRYSVFNLVPGPYQDVCGMHEIVVTTSFFEHVTLPRQRQRSRQVLLSLTMGKLPLPMARGNDSFTVVRIDRYTLAGEVDPFYRRWEDIPRTGQWEHRILRVSMIPGRYRLAIFAHHPNPLWELGDGRKYGREPWRKEWLLEWRKEYTDVYAVSFDVPEWKGQNEEEAPPCQIKINLDVAVGLTSRTEQ